MTAQGPVDRASRLAGMTTDPFAPWGKVARATGDVHRLVYHCLDVGAVAFELLERSAASRGALARLLGIPAEHVPAIAAWLVALHDVGKVHPTFQGLVPDVAARLGAPAAGPYTLRHDTLGALAFEAGLERAIAERLGRAGDTAWADRLRELRPCLAGHHGAPPVTHDKAGIRVRASLRWPANALARAQDVALALADAIGVPREMGLVRPEEGFARASWDVAGFVTLCDWLGSDVTHFRYLDEVVDLEAYWADVALPSARDAVRASGVLPAAVRHDGPPLFSELATLSSAQQLMLTTPLAEGGALYILEDQTGSGKTEGALLLAQRLLKAGHADGLYFALPTMATADRMHDRLKAIYRSLFREGELPSLTLAHGGAKGGGAADDSGPLATAWLADSRKRALLAHVGVGTIDQALLGVLAVKHQSLRLFGLSSKVLVVDEVHAYDPYPLILLERLLEHHLARGGSAILLSATMPQALRARLCGLASRKMIASDAYPLFTAASGDVHETPLAARPELAREVRVVLHERSEDALHVLAEAKAAGRCACWIRNTIADVLEAAEAARALEPDVLHARFMAGDRAERERTLAEWAGPQGTPAARAGRTVIASPVVEQSMDIDFDALVTDLAPMDLLLQRLGRLQRHARPGRPPPVLHVLAPPWSESPGEDWYESALPHASAVYPDHGALWRTHRALRTGRLRIPADARTLIEDVFGNAASDPGGLAKRGRDAQVRRGVESSVAMVASLRLEEGYCTDDTKWGEDAETATRYGDRTRDAWLSTVDADGGRRPLHPAGWDASRVRVPAHWVAPDPESLRGISSSRGGARIDVHPLDGRHVADVRDPKGALLRLAYDSRLGLYRIEEAPA